MIILAADIGGSQARLLLGESEAGSWRTLRQETLPSPEFRDVESLLRRFLKPSEQPGVACFAVAGPVTGARMQMTNLPWTLDSQALTEHFGLRRVHLINDFAAQAFGLPLLQASDLRTLHPGTVQEHGVRALIGAGTGLGMALLAEPADGTPVPLPSEGGHADFAPRDAQQLALLQYLQPLYGRVSLELLLSGHGLERLYCFVARLPACTPSASLNAAAISAAALAGDAQAAAAVNLFARLLVSAAGNLALTSLARGGVFLSGGIAPKILPFLQQPAVVAAFYDKPPMRELLEKIPLHVVTNEHLGLLGAARMAAQLATPFTQGRE